LPGKQELSLRHQAVFPEWGIDLAQAAEPEALPAFQGLAYVEAVKACYDCRVSVVIVSHKLILFSIFFAVVFQILQADGKFC
jgi:hypothetical protein